MLIIDSTRILSRIDSIASLSLSSDRCPDDAVARRGNAHAHPSFGRRVQTMSGGVGGGQVRPIWEGRKYLLCEGFGSDSVTGDVLRKKYIMLTKFYYVRT